MKSIDEHDWDKIKRLRKKGLTFKELGDQFGINKATVWYRLAEMGKDKEEIDWGKGQALRNAGWSVGAIAKELKTTQQKVYYHTKKPAPRKHYENEWNRNEPSIMKSNNLI